MSTINNDFKVENIICINKWYGRLGNNIIQLHNAILIGLYFNCNVTIPAHSFFSTKLIKINNDTSFTPLGTESAQSASSLSLITAHKVGVLNVKRSNKVVKITHPNNYFESDIINFTKKIFLIFLNDPLLKNVEQINSDMFSKYYVESLRILRRCFVIQNDCIYPIGDNDLVIHIRTGDIFRDDGVSVHPKYYQPPLCFYLSILEKKFDNVYLVAEDTKNPCINTLLKLFPDIKYNKNNLTEDIKLILSAKNVVSSKGTFVRSLLKLSKNIVHMYSYNFDSKYLKIMHPWRNNEKQRETMLSFKGPYDKHSCYKIDVFDNIHRNLKF